MNLAASRMLTQKATTLLRRFRQQVDGPVQPDLQKVIAILQAGETSLIFQIGTVTAKTGLNHVAGFRVGADIAWQRQQLQRRLQIDCRRGHALGQG